MMIAGRWDGRISRARIRPRGSALLIEAGFVPYATGSCWTQARRGVVGL